MRKNLLSPLMLAFALCFGFGQAFGQAPCTPDLQYNSPGIFPSDTLPELTVGQSYNEVVHFVFPSDTTISGFTLDFDSFVVSSVSNVPAGLTWDCDQNTNGCVYLTTPPALTRGCVAIAGTPTGGTANYPAYDSIIVVGDGWVTVPFIGATNASQEIPVYFRTFDPATSIEAPLVQDLNLAIAPSPASFSTQISFNLSETAHANVSIVNTVGQQVYTVASEKDALGEFSYPVNLSDLPTGIYYVRVELNDGEYVKTKKFTVIH